MYTHSPNPSKQYAILRKIRGSRDQAIPGYFAPQEQIPWVRGCLNFRLRFDPISVPHFNPISVPFRILTPYPFCSAF
jgi:hypothetical protein